jgi:dethiobiotin synthetase
MHGMGASYWKPVQTGTQSELSDAVWIQRTLNLPDSKFLPAAYQFSLPQSPHWAARAEGATIRQEQLHLPKDMLDPLIIETAGGVMAPLREDLLYIDIMKDWQLPVVLVLDNYLGCINHTLLSVEALRSRNIPLAGLIYNRNPHPEISYVIEQQTQLPVLGTLPPIKDWSPEGLLEIYQALDFVQEEQTTESLS